MILRVSVLRPQPSSFAASSRLPRARRSAVTISVRSNAGSASSSSGGAAVRRELTLGPLREPHRPVRGRLRRAAAELVRQILHRDLTARGRDREPTAHVHELADVARPVVLLQHLGRFGAQRLRRDAELVRGLLEIEARELANVLAALAQRRCLDPHDVQAVVQVLAEAARGDGLSEILMRRGDHADVDSDRRLAADAEEFALGEHAQQPRL